MNATIVKVKQCSKPSYWYKDKIDCVFEVYGEEDDAYLVWTGERFLAGQMDMDCILKTDAVPITAAPAPDLLPFLTAKWKVQLEGYYSVHATAEQRTVRLAVLEEYGWLISMHLRGKLKQLK